MGKHWTQSEIVSLTGAKPSDVQNWVNRNYVQPVNDSPGKSGKRLYDFGGLVAIAAMHAGARSGLPAHVMSETLSEIVPRAERILKKMTMKSSSASENSEVSPKKVLIYARSGENWSVAEALLDEDEEESFDASDLPDSFVVLQLDRMVRRLILRAWPNGLDLPIPPDRS